MSSRKAVEYWRWSDKDQEQGDTFDRQHKAIIGMIQQNGWEHCPDLLYKDEGESGWTGQHAQTGELGRLVDDLEGGRLPKNAVLVLENPDRFSRMDVRETQLLLWRILDAGCWIASSNPPIVLKPGDEQSLMTAFPFLMGTERGHGESQRKSSMVRSGWRARVAAQIEDGPDGTGNGPGWMISTESGWQLIPERAELLRQMHAWIHDGLGTPRIARKLNTMGEVTWRNGVVWSPGAVHRILSRVAAYGAYQPCEVKKDGRKRIVTPIGDPVEGHYPPVISKSDFELTQTLMASRRGKLGRVGKDGPANLFTGLTFLCPGNLPMIGYSCVSKGKTYHYLRCNRPVAAEGDQVSMVRYDWLETPILRLIADLDIEGLCAKDGTATDSATRKDALKKQLATLRGRADLLTQQLSDADLPDSAMARIVKGIKDCAEQERRVTQQLQEIALQFPVEPSAALEGSQDTIQLLLKVAGTDEEPLIRSRLRSQVRMLVDSIRIRVQEFHRRTVAIHVHVRFHAGGQRWLPILPNPLPAGCKLENWQGKDFASMKK